MQVTEHIHAIKIPFKIPIGPQLSLDRFVYAFLIYGSRICLIDTGVNSAETTIFEYLHKTGRRPKEIDMIILTHSHPDHIGAAHSIKKATGCLIAAHFGDKNWIEDVDRQCRERPVPGFHSLVGGPVDINRMVEEGDILELGDGLSLEVFHTPGHSEGSISLWLPADRALFCGDAVPLPGDLPIYDDYKKSVCSIMKLKSLTGIHTLLSAWDDPRKGDSIYQLMGESISFLQRIHELVARNVTSDTAPEIKDLCRQVAISLGLPASAATPMLARSLQANLRTLGL